MMVEILLGVLLVIAILAVSAVITQLFANRMYNRCPGCAALNAQRRSHCRKCGRELTG